jgi:NAD(P)-dependent dehydrogenase (short-subunit alcohol dehydrogenase family)
MAALDDMSEFIDKVVMVTGAAGNLGAATADAFAARMAKLALVDRDTRRLEFLEGRFGDPARIGGFSTDLLDRNAVQQCVRSIMDRFGRIDVLCNIAGGFTMGPSLYETPSADWDFMMDLNARSVFHCCAATVPHMLAAGKGRIVNVSAGAAREGRAGMGPYCASKAVVIRLTETLAAEHKHDDINVNCILPGTVDTPQNRASMPDADHSLWVPPAALADVVVFLCSASSRAINGAAIPVFGRS